MAKLDGGTKVTSATLPAWATEHRVTRRFCGVACCKNWHLQQYSPIFFAKSCTQLHRLPLEFMNAFSTHVVGHLAA